MKLKGITILTIALSSLVFTGCTPSPQEAVAINKDELSKDGESVGNLPDGRAVKRWTVWSPDATRVHYIYVVDGATTVSTNRLEAQGKTSVNRTDVVVINGKEYVPVR